MSLVSVYCVFADADEAERIGRIVVEERLAACINVVGPCRSIYWWNGKVEVAAEVPAFLKTTSDVVDALLARIAALHSYDVPAMMVLPLGGAHDGYAKWVAEVTG